MYVRFPLSLRNVEDLLFERGIDICHETVRLWWNRFGPLFVSDIRQELVSRMRGFRHRRWHLDETYVKLNGNMDYLWRAVDHEGVVLESYVTKSRDKPDEILPIVVQRRISVVGAFPVLQQLGGIARMHGEPDKAPLEVDLGHRDRTRCAEHMVLHLRAQPVLFPEGGDEIALALAVRLPRMLDVAEAVPQPGSVDDGHAREQRTPRCRQLPIRPRAAAHQPERQRIAVELGQLC